MRLPGRDVVCVTQCGLDVELDRYQCYALWKNLLSFARLNLY